MAAIIFTADDFGVIDSLNNGIIELAKRGIINSVEVLTNYGKDGSQSLANVKKLLQEAEAANQQIELGVHLTITSGKSLTKDAGLNPILDKDGNFKTFGNTSSGAFDQALYNELASQVNVLYNDAEAKKYLTHLTIHHDSLWFFDNYTLQLMKICSDFGNLPVRNPNSIPKTKNSFYNLMVVPGFAAGKMTSGDKQKVKQAYNLRRKGQFFGQAIRFKSTDYMDSRFYGPIPQDNIRSEAEQRDEIQKKAQKIVRMINADFSEDGDETMHMPLFEFMFHPRKGKSTDRKKDFKKEVADADYSGIDPLYFDSRFMEYAALMQNEETIKSLMQHGGHRKASWKEAREVRYEVG